MKKIILPFVFVLICSLFVSCGEGISSDTAKQTANDFFSCITNGDFDGAAGLMHPSRETSADDLRTYFDGLEEKTGADFSCGIEIVRQTNFSSALYDSDVDGSSYSIGYDVTVGEKEFEVDILFVKNDAGYGIYNVEFDVED